MQLFAEATVFDDSKLNADMQGVKQYFWHVKQGDNAGTHITEVPQEQFVISPNGYNLLARSSGVYIRDGLDRIAEFEPDGVNFNAIVDSSLVSVAEYGVNGARIGESTKTHTIIDSGGMQVYADDGVTLIANLGYGEGNAESGTANAPFYSLGIRNTTDGVGNYSFTSGRYNTASMVDSFAMGNNNSNEGKVSGTFGFKSSVTEAQSIVDPDTHTVEVIGGGFGSHAFGAYTCSNRAFQTVIGIANVIDNNATGYDSDSLTSVIKLSRGKYAFIIGNGRNRQAIYASEDDIVRSNALTVDWSGNQWIAGTLTQGSDRRLKEHICYLSQDAIDFVRELKPAHYIKSKEKHVGFYAQDVQKIDKWDCMVGEDDNGYLTLGYTEIIAPLVTYCQHLEKRIEELEKK